MSTEFDLDHHGDAEKLNGQIDFAVNIRGQCPPLWLQQRLAARIGDLADYPSADDEARARTSVARWHNRADEEVLLLSGAAEGFSLLASLPWRQPACIHPSFTEPEAALIRAGHHVHRAVAPWPYRLSDAAVPESADLVVLGNPTNPTSVLHSRDEILQLRRPGRLLVVDEAFMDLCEDSTNAPTRTGAQEETPSASLAHTALPGVLVFRSLTKTFSLAGLRIGYALGEKHLLDRLAQRRPHWPLGTLQLEAITACTSSEGREALEAIRATMCLERTQMLNALSSAGITVAVPPVGPFLLAQVPTECDPQAFRLALRERGVTVRRADTFPGLAQNLVRLAVRESTMVDALLSAWAAAEADTRRTRSKNQ